MFLSEPMGGGCLESGNLLWIGRRRGQSLASWGSVLGAKSGGNSMEEAMGNSSSTLLIRNLRDVFGENDPARRRAAIDELYTEDCVFYDPSKGVYRGRDEIDRIAGAIKATHPDFRYQPITEPAESDNGGLVRWVSGRPGEAPAYAGTDFIIVRDGRIAAIYLFFDKLS
jgi:ketosteroid isomerase-like protein